MQPDSTALNNNEYPGVTGKAVATKNEQGGSTSHGIFQGLNFLCEKEGI